MKCFNMKQRKGTIIAVILIILAIKAVALYCIYKFLMSKHDESDTLCNCDDCDSDEDEFIDENGICYTDEKNFVN